MSSASALARRGVAAVLPRPIPSLGHLPGPRGADFVRLMLHFMADSVGALEASQARYGDVVAYHWPVSTVLLFDPVAIRRVLIENAANYEKGAQTEELAVLMGAGLVTNNDRVSWAQRLPFVNRALSASAVRGMLPSLTESIERELASLDVGAGAEVDVAPLMRRISFQIACRMLLGEAVSARDAARIDEAVWVGSRVVHRHMFSLLPVPYWVPLRSHRALGRARRRLDEVIGRCIAEARHDGGEADRGILGRLVSAEGQAAGFDSDAAVRDELVTLLIAGYETTANALAWTLCLLARHPDAQDQLRDQSRLPSSVDLRALRTTHRPTYAVIAESLRLYPTIPMSSRRALADDRVAGVHLPAGTNVVIPTWNVHRDERHFEQPARFCPARFESSATDGGAGYAPFSKGERGCVGRTFALVEIANVLLRVVSAFDLEAVGEMPAAVSEVSLRPTGGARLRLRRRA